MKRIIKVNVECGQRWYRWRSWKTCKFFRKLEFKGFHGIAVGPLMIWKGDPDATT